MKTGTLRVKNFREWLLSQSSVRSSAVHGPVACCCFHLSSVLSLKLSFGVEGKYSPPTPSAKPCLQKQAKVGGQMSLTYQQKSFRLDEIPRPQTVKIHSARQT